MTGVTTIVFGAAGRVGAATARAAAERGARVVLALRDPEKPVPGLTAEQEREGGFERVQADLAQPDSAAEAVRRTGATRAFLYALPGGTPDHLRATAAALQAAGVEFAVVLSSASVTGDIRAIDAGNLVQFAHAQVEASVEDAFGPSGYAAVRPTFFASNAFWWKAMVKQGEVRTVYPDARVDWITSSDIGRVCGSLLVAGRLPTEAENAVRLTGPQLASFRDAVGVIAKAIGKDIKVTEISDEKGVEFYVNECGFPAFLAQALVDNFRARAAGRDNGAGFSGPAYEEAVANIQKYGGRRPTTLEEWVEENKHAFQA